MVTEKLLASMHWSADSFLFGLFLVEKNLLILASE